jgi:hypothetical protein
MPKRDVDCAEASRRQPRDHPAAPGRHGGEVRIDPRHDLVDQWRSDPAGPFAVVARVRPGRRHDGDERLDRALFDLGVGPVCEVGAREVLGRGARHAVQQVDDRVALGTVEARRQVDEAGPLLAREDAGLHGAARWPGREGRKAGEQRGGCEDRQQRDHPRDGSGRQVNSRLRLSSDGYN